ncbi:MAG: Wzz/FepE/Etk N-terminal domain-containing protein [Candidatus Aminicenantes bacterium]|nr:Wzz/FepE/Etk N-terminal domain-containing protein [Candidatus Aminicenantes bacterium]
MEEYENEFELMDYLNVIWKKKWLIIIPTFILVVLVGIYSLTLPKVWEIDAILIPSKIILRTDVGQFEEVLVVNPKQIVGQINQASYNNLIAAEMKLDIKKFPKIEAENLRDTNLVRISIKEQDIDKSKSILLSLFYFLKIDLDEKIKIEISDLDTQVESNNNRIKTENNRIKLKESFIAVKNLNIESKEMEKTGSQEEINTLKNKLIISKERTISIAEEMTEVKKRIDQIENELQNVLKTGNDTNALSLLLYSVNIQNSLMYYNTLNEKLSIEKLTQENINLDIEEKKRAIKQADNQIEQIKTQIEDTKTEIDDINTEIESVKNDISLLNEKKAWIDYAELVKEPTSSLNPVAPRKKVMVMVAGMLGLFIFTMLAFFLDYIAKQKIKVKG